MLRRFTHSKSWMVASLLVATAAFGQDGRCTPEPACAPCVKTCPCPAPMVKLSPAYSAPAAITIGCAWDLNVNASFIYWQAMQDNMELGFATTTPVASLTPTPPLAGVQGDWIEMDFKFKPGFKVGLGMSFDYDNWDAQAEYTWFHNTNHRSSNGPGLPGSILPSWGTYNTSQPSFVNFVRESWRLNMDLIDLDLGRSYYVGTKLTMRPSFGARAAFIHQKVHVVNQSTGSPSAIDTLDIKQESGSWGLGTKAGLETNWMIGEGFRLFANGEADLLFTRYTKANYSSTLSSSAALSENVREKNINTLRTHLDVVSGVGYGTYLDCNNWYVDISAGYEFQVFYDQNMFGNVPDMGLQIARPQNANGNLYIQGLTVKAELDF